ncbi:MAG: DNA-binding response regulator [Bacteroidales bacterium]|nr:MAG: DNA-binding response regulator [Bacteroidales bacterium]
MNIAIFEDEAFAAEHLEQMLVQLVPGIRILAKISTVRKGIEWLKNNSCDLIFLDINLADGLSFKIFESVQVKTPIIFTTAYDQYAIKAFELNSIDYLLKPISIAILSKSIEKYRQLNSPQQIVHNLKEVLRNLNNAEPIYRERFSVEMGSKIKTVEVTDIAYFYALSKSTFFRTLSGHNYPCDLSLDRLAEIINPKSFFRVNRGYIVNLKAIAGMNLMSNRSIKLTLTPNTDEIVLVSISRLADFKKWLNI